MDSTNTFDNNTSSGDLARRMKIARNLASEARDMDAGLPEWARRSNPIIRRQLGIHWRVFLPQTGPIVRWLLLQSGIILLTLQFEALFAPLMLLALSTAFMLPFGFYLYLQSLHAIAGDSVQSMGQEFANDTFDLVRVTPYSLLQIVLSKTAASVWRRMEDLDTIIAIALFTSLPVITFMQVLKWPPDLQPGYSQIMIILLMATAVLRLPLEMFMVSAIGVMNGASVRWRSPATTATLVVSFFYFLLLNLPRLIDMSLEMQIFVEVLLPLLLPVVISAGAIAVAVRIIDED